MSEYRPWLVWETLEQKVHQRYLWIHCMRLVFSWVCKRYFRRILGQLWILGKVEGCSEMWWGIGLLCNDLAVTMERGVGVVNGIFGCFEGCFIVTRRVGLSWDLLYWHCDRRGPGMNIRYYSLKKHNATEYLGCYQVFELFV